MTVLHVSGSKSWGGNEQQLVYLIEELNKLGVVQKVFCFGETPLLEELKTIDVEIFSIEKSKVYSTKYRRFLSQIIKNNSIDIIHLHTSDAVTGFVITDILHRLNTPAIFAKKGIRAKSSLLSRLKYNYRNINKVLCVSDYVKVRFQKELFTRNHHKLTTVYDGVKPNEREAEDDLRKRLGITDEVFLIGNIGNHTNAKDIPTLINAADFLVNKLQEKKVHFLQIGKFSKSTPGLQAQVDELGLAAHFTFTGFLKDASTFLPQLDVFVMSSSREGGPSSILEAFNYRIPVVSTEVGVVGEVLQDGVNAFVVEVGDFEGMARKIQILKNNRVLSQQFSELCYNIFLENFTAKKLGESTFEAYQELLADKM